jgi:16S rRNA (uracil1498-N3)-methyltransferase
LRVESERSASTEPLFDLTLAPAVGKGKTLEEVVAATAALGVNRIAPFLGRNSVAGRSNPKALERMRILAIEACRQSGRTCPPSIDEVAETVEKRLEEATDRGDLIGFLDERGGADPGDVLLDWDGKRGVTLFCGPEGGWEEEERRRLLEVGRGVTLGPRTLRTELAAVVGTALFERSLSERLGASESSKAEDSME